MERGKKKLEISHLILCVLKVGKTFMVVKETFDAVAWGLRGGRSGDDRGM